MAKHRLRRPTVRQRARRALRTLTRQTLILGLALALLGPSNPPPARPRRGAQHGNPA